MAAPSMLVRIAANVAELKRNMAEGKDQVEVLRAGFQKLATSFQGDKIIQQAHNVTAAVHSIGGASKLTEAEQARVNATVERALEKYRVLGREAPQALKDLAAQTQKAEERTSFLSSATQRLVALFSVAAVASMANKVLDLTGKLTDLSGKTGISAEGLQILQFSLGQSGISMEQAANAAVKMSKGLVGDDKAAVAAVNALHLNVQDLIAAGPEQAFLSIGSAIAGVPNPMERAALATAVFGKAGADLLPGFTTNMRELGDQARASGAIISNELVASGDAAGDAWTRLQSSGMALIANVFLPLAPGIEIVVGWLATALPAALNVSRNGLDLLIRKGMELEIWLASTAASITETVAAVPVLGRVFGQTGGDVDYFKERAQQARDTLAAFTVEGVTPAARATEAVTPLVTDFASAMERTARTSREAAVAVGAMQGPAADLINLESRAISDTAKLTKELERWAQVNGATLAPSIRQVNAAMSEQAPLVAVANTNWVGFAGTVQQHSATAGAASGGFFSNLKGAMGEAGINAGTLSSLFAQAFTGGGGAMGAIKAFATQGMSALLGMIPGVGPFVQQFAGPIISGLSALAGKAKALLSSIFGGPDAAEKEGRRQVAEYEAQLQATLTETQRLEAGTDSWRQTVVAVRDAYIAAGRTEAEALAAVDALWKSSKGGADAVAAAIANIKAGMSGMAAATDTAADATAGLGDATMTSERAAAMLGQALGDVQLAQGLIADVERLGGSTDDVIRAEQQLKDAMSKVAVAQQAIADTDALKVKTHQVEQAALASQRAFEGIKTTIGQIPRDIDVSITGTYNTEGELPGYASGSGGIRNFGRGTLAVLHGRERVQTEAQMQAEQQTGGGSDIATRLEALIGRLEYVLPLTIRDAVLQGRG